MYEPDLEPFEFSPGLENKGRNIFAITFENHTGDNTTLLVGYAVEGGSSLLERSLKLSRLQVLKHHHTHLVLSRY